MNKCLNCGKEVKNKYCNASCQNKYKQEQQFIKYMETTKTCLCCGVELEYSKRKNIYCSISCSNKTSNVGKSRQKNLIEKLSEYDIKKIFEESNNISDFFKLAGYKTTPSLIIKDYTEKRLNILGLTLNSIKNIRIEIKDLTKGQLFEKRSNWQSARGAIVKDAKKIFINHNKEKKCVICGYNKTYTVAHLKPVFKFSDDSLISEINNINNLIALCPNHHFEYDNGLLDKVELQKIKKYTAGWRSDNSLCS